MVWGLNYPPFAKNLGQPAKGIALTVLTLLIAAVISAIVYYTVDTGMGPPTPFTIIYVIFAVLITFWFVVVWGCWPVTAVTDSPFIKGLTALLVTYLLGYLLFWLLFDFGFMAQAPFYSPDLDPQGAFMAWDILSFSVTTVAIVFLLIMFDFWPMTAVPALRGQPLLGLSSTVFILILTGIVFWIAKSVLGMDSVRFMVFGSIAFLFGTLIPIIIFESKPFAAKPQPVAGLGRLVIALIAAIVLTPVYWNLGPVVSGQLLAGPPDYQYELWLASALLAMTFPMMVVVAQFFDYWPIRARPAAESSASESAE